MSKPPLSDNQAGDLLDKARELVAAHKGETVHAETALRTAETALSVIQAGLLVASEKSRERMP